MAFSGSIGSLLVLSLLRGDTCLAQEHHHEASGEKLGTVRFETSCSEAAQPQFNRALALLHSFEFGRAIEAFQTTLATDPRCAMAYWGIALSRWSNPFAAGAKPVSQLRQGREAVEQAKAADAGTERERGYIAAVARLYSDFERTDQRSRVLAYESAMADLASKYPQDREASIFHALALAASAPQSDKTYAKARQAGAILEKILPEQPDHPGIAHYIIHSYDFPPLAARAIDAARRYALIAPSAPHALHMPSHTFTRLGYWQDSIDTNIKAAEAARRDGSTAEELHTMDYRSYAYLQTAQDQAARRMLDALPAVAARFNPDAIGSAASGAAGVFALAAIPARWALERGSWAEAARLEPGVSRFAHTEAITHFARSLGGSRSGQLGVARASAEALQQIKERLARAGEGYWAEQVEIQRRSASAWLALAEGRSSEALAEMRAAAQLEDASEKDAVTPGPIAPARELLGEMLLRLKQPAAALKEFQSTLEKEPNRFRAVHGAARAAALAGDRASARTYYAGLLKTCEKADRPGRAELEEARSFVAGATSN